MHHHTHTHLYTYALRQNSIVGGNIRIKRTHNGTGKIGVVRGLAGEALIENPWVVRGLAGEALIENPSPHLRSLLPRKQSARNGLGGGGGGRRGCSLHF